MTSDNLKLSAAALILVFGIGAFYHFSDIASVLRLLIILVAAAAALATALQTGPGREAWGFVADSRGEIRKIVWPTQTETVQATAVVMGMVVVMALLLWFLDALLLWAVRFLTGPGT